MVSSLIVVEVPFETGPVFLDLGTGEQLRKVLSPTFPLICTLQRLTGV